jgi:hypothetical protein
VFELADLAHLQCGGRFALHVVHLHEKT